jgi:hypothetical protein
VKPEVLFWALFFVVAVGLVFRVFSRSSRRDNHTPGDPEALLTAPNETAAEHAAPTMKTPEPTHFTAAPVAAEPSRPALAQPVQTAAPQQTDDVPSPALPRFVAPATSANAARERTVIAAPDVKATLHPAAVTKRDGVILAPSVKATLPPGPVAQSGAPSVAPSIRATLPPAPIPTPVALAVQPDVKATLPRAPVATPTAPIVARVVEPALPLAVNIRAVTESPEMLLPDLESAPVPGPITIRLRGTRLRARRLGQVMPPLDERIKETRSRKICGRLKTRRKHKPSPKAPRKAPARRIAAAPNVDNTFISAKATTKIVGAPPKPLRVRLATSP